MKADWAVGVVMAAGEMEAEEEEVGMEGEDLVVEARVVVDWVAAKMVAATVEEAMAVEERVVVEVAARDHKRK